jgi:ABC-type Fe3+ transport system permease subunit
VQRAREGLTPSEVAPRLPAITDLTTAGSQNEAAALGFILIVVAALSLLVINRVAGTRMGMFG